MTHAIHRSLLGTPLTAVMGEGPYVIDSEGKRFLDGCGGAAVSILGHNHPKVIAAIIEQAQTLPYAHTSFFTTTALELLADDLVKKAPGMSHALLLSGGSEAVEASLKLARQYFLEKGEKNRSLFIARKQSYHGNTLGALAVGGCEWRRRPFAPLLKRGHHISPCFEYRWRGSDESQLAFGLRVADELEEMILKLGPENVAGFVAETVAGATAGAVAAVPGYFKRIREICDRYGVLLILDEVMCGTGRTGSLMAYEQEDVIPDIVTLAKGLGAGYQPLGAVMTNEEIVASIRDGSGFFQHGHTFMGHAISAAAGLATLSVIEEEGLLHNVRRRGESLIQQLREVLSDHPNVGDVRGRGLLIGVEFVEDREQKKPFSFEKKVHKHLKNTAMDNGLMCYAMGGTIDGQSGDHVLLAPAYTINQDHEDELVTKFLASVQQTFSTGRLAK